MVDFPAPLGPNNPKNSPCGIDKDIPFTALTVP
jgi:hypothetical protein